MNEPITPNTEFGTDEDVLLIPTKETHVVCVREGCPEETSLYDIHNVWVLER
jgi:hypothetical protein